MKRHLLTATLLLLAPALVNAQAARNAHEAAIDNRQIMTDKAQLDRDVAEIAAFETALGRLDAGGTTVQYVDASRNIRAAMAREVEQARRKVGQATHEVNQSRREARGEQVEANVTGAPRNDAQAADDRHDKRDDRRDRRGRAELLQDMERVAAQAASLQTAIARGDPNAMRSNTALAREFLLLMKEDVAQTRNELGEDRGERREDRRERRTDRRQAQP